MFMMHSQSDFGALGFGKEPVVLCQVVVIALKNANLGVLIFISGIIIQQKCGCVILYALHHCNNIFICPVIDTCVCALIFT